MLLNDGSWELGAEFVVRTGPGRVRDTGASGLGPFLRSEGASLVLVVRDSGR